MVLKNYELPVNIIVLLDAADGAKVIAVDDANGKRIGSAWKPEGSDKVFAAVPGKYSEGFPVDADACSTDNAFDLAVEWIKENA